MATEKLWYTGIKEARVGANSQEIANWFKQANVSSNPYIYRKVPRTLVPFYLYCMQKVEATQFEKGSVVDKIQTILLATLSKGLSEVKLLQGSLALCIPILITGTDTVVLQIKDYMRFVPTAEEKLYQSILPGALIFYIDVFTEVLEFDSFVQSGFQNKFLNTKAWGDLLSKYILTPLVQIKHDPKQPEETIAKLDRYFQAILQRYLEEKEETVVYKGIVLKNLEKYFRFFPSKYNNVGRFSEKFVEAFKIYFTGVSDADLQEKLRLFFFKVDAVKSDPKINLELTELFDEFQNTRDTNAPNIQIFPVQEFRTDFNSTSAAFQNKITPKEYTFVAEKFFEAKQTFSSFYNLAREKSEKQEIIDSLLQNPQFTMKQFAGEFSRELGWKVSGDEPMKIDDPNAQLKSDKAALLAAIREGNLSKVKGFAPKVTSMNLEWEKERPLDVAMEVLTEDPKNSDLEILKVLLGAGAQVDTAQAGQELPLFKAIRLYRDDVACSILKDALPPPSPDLVDTNGKTASQILDELLDMTTLTPKQKTALQNIEACMPKQRPSATVPSPTLPGPPGPTPPPTPSELSAKRAVQQEMNLPQKSLVPSPVPLGPPPPAPPTPSPFTETNNNTDTENEDPGLFGRLMGRPKPFVGGGGNSRRFKRTRSTKRKTLKK